MESARPEPMPATTAFHSSGYRVMSARPTETLPASGQLIAFFFPSARPDERSVIDKRTKISMAKDKHMKAAEHHEAAAKTHKHAAAMHEKGDHSAHEHSSKAHESSKMAHDASTEAHEASKSSHKK